MRSIRISLNFHPQPRSYRGFSKLEELAPSIIEVLSHISVCVFHFRFSLKHACLYDWSLYSRFFLSSSILAVSRFHCSFSKVAFIYLLNLQTIAQPRFNLQGLQNFFRALRWKTFSRAPFGVLANCDLVQFSGCQQRKRWKRTLKTK